MYMWLVIETYYYYSLTCIYAKLHQKQQQQYRNEITLKRIIATNLFYNYSFTTTKAGLLLKA